MVNKGQNSQQFITISSVFLILIVLSQMVKYLTIVDTTRVEHLLSVGAILFFIFSVPTKIRFFYTFFLMGLPAFVIFVFHGYVHWGLMLAVLLSLSLSGLSYNEKKVNVAFDLLFYSIILLSFYGVLASGDPHFLRHGLQPIPFQNVLLFFSTNKTAYTLTTLFAVFTYWYLDCRISLSSLLLRFAASFFVIAVVAESRLATVAILFQFAFAISVSASKFSAGLRSLVFVTVGAILIFSGTQLSSRFNQMSSILDDTISGIQSHEVLGNARAKILTGSYLVALESPIIGHGAYVALEKFEEYGVVRSDEFGVSKTLPLHGSILPIILAGGFLSGLLYSASFLMVFGHLISVRKHSRPISYGGISLLISALIVQFGGDFFTQVIFISVLGYFLSLCSSARSLILSASDSHLKV